MENAFDTLVVITPKDFIRLTANYEQLVKCLPSRRILFVGSKEVEEQLLELNLGDKVGFINENDIIPFDDVHNCFLSYMSEYLAGREWTRGCTGWYYQQFLKMKYSEICKDKYYMTWDGDTIPCKPFSMFKENTDIPYMDVKEEYHEEYFNTMGVLFPGFKKCISSSFISEHMLFNCEIMRNLINRIMANTSLTGETFYERIIKSIPVDKVASNSFSEFETYGTFVCYTNPTAYKIREWHSFRLGGEFFNPETITEKDYEWLGKDFFAISFEKGHSVREDHKNLFDNPEYQSKLSAKQMLLIAQEEFEEGYLEKWNDEEEQLVVSGYNGYEDIKKSILNDVEFIGDLQDTLLKVCSIWGPKTRVHIDEETCLCNALLNTSSGEIYVGAYTFCGHNVSIITGTHDVKQTMDKRMDFKTEGNDIHIGKGVWLCSNVTILGPCIIDDNAVVAAGSIVLPGTHIKSNELWAGNPAKYKKIV